VQCWRRSSRVEPSSTECHEKCFQRAVRRLRFEPFRRVEREETSTVDERDAIAELVGFRHIVRRHDDGASLRMEVAQNLPQRIPRLRIEPDRRLVEEEDRWLVDQRARDHEPLLLSTAQLVDFRLRFVGNFEPFEQRRRATSGLARVDPEIGGVVDQILPNIERAIGIGTLRDDADALPYTDAVAHDVRAGDHGRSGGGEDAGRQDPDRRRFPRPVRTDHPKKFALVDVEVDPLEGEYAPLRVLLAQTSRLNGSGHPGKFKADRFRGAPARPAD